MIHIDNNTLIKDLTVEQFRLLIAGANLKEENTLTIEAVKKTVRYSITDTAKILGITPKTLRKHTKEGKIKCSYSKTNNRRSYLGADILKYYGSTW